MRGRQLLAQERVGPSPLKLVHLTRRASMTSIPSARLRIDGDTETPFAVSRLISASVDGAVRVSEHKLVLPLDGWLLAIFVKRNPGILCKAGLAVAAEHPKDNGDECGNEKQKKYRHRHCRLS